MDEKNKKILYGIIVFILVAVVIGVFFSYPKFKESVIKSEIDLANYCDVSSDCVDVGGKCPFGCYVYVNKAEAGRISEMVDSFDSKCVYSCLACPSVVCESNKCREVCE